VQGGLRVALDTLPLEIQRYKVLPEEQKNGDARNAEYADGDQLKPDRRAYPLYVPSAVILGRKYPRARGDPEHAQIEHKEELIRNGDGAHLLCTDPPHHDIIEHAHEIGYAVLQQDRDRDGEDRFVKCGISDEFSVKGLSHPGVYTSIVVVRASLRQDKIAATTVATIHCALYRHSTSIAIIAPFTQNINTESV
jgi:hypothetical protein